MHYFAGEPQITHSKILDKGRIYYVEVRFGRFDGIVWASTDCLLLDYIWSGREEFSNAEI